MGWGGGHSPSSDTEVGLMLGGGGWCRSHVGRWGLVGWGGGHSPSSDTEVGLMLGGGGWWVGVGGHSPSSDTEVGLVWADVVDVMMSSGQDHVVVL